MGKIEEIRKEKLDQLTQRIASQIGVKPTEQELINAAIELAEMHFDEFLSQFTTKPALDPPAIHRVLGIIKHYSKNVVSDSQHTGE